jgi:hypothetical protein
LFVSGAINGLPVVRFNATNQTYLEFPRPVKDDFTIFCVFQSRQGIGTETNFYQGAGLVNGEVPWPVDDYGISLNANGRILAGTGNPDRTVASSNSGFNDGKPHLVAFKRTRSNGRLELHVDGVLQGTNTGGQQALNDPPRLVLGAQQTEILFLTGDIAEVKIYDAALSTSDRMAEENALNCKYGLGGGAAPPAPAGLSGTPGNRQIRLSWSPVVGSAGYQVSWSSSSSGPFTELISDLTATVFVDGHAGSGQTNYYKVAAHACGLTTESPPIAVFLPLPPLGISAGTSGLTFTWPDWADDWILSSTTNLSPPALWSPITNPVSNCTGYFEMTLPIGPGNRFFRLASP